MFMQMRSRRRRGNADDTSRQTPYAKRQVVVTPHGSLTVRATGGSVVRNVRVGPPVAPSFFDRPAGRLLVYGSMLAFCVAFWWLVISLVTAKAAHGADCNVLHGADERHMCRATTQCLKSECEFISKPDLRQVCRIRVEEWC